MERKKNHSIQTLLNSRFSLYTFLVIITLCFISTYTQIYDVKLDMNGDNIHYYALGKALADGKGFTNTISFNETPHTHFPPGYPVFIAGIMKFFPDNIQAIKIANGILLYAAIILLFFLLRKLSGNLIIPFLSCVFCSIHAEILRYATIMMSEMLFLFCSVGAIYLALSIKPDQLFSRKGIRDSLFLLLLLFLNNYIYFVRTMGTSVILAIILYSGILFIQQLYRFFKNRKEWPDGAQKRTAILRLSRYALLFILLTGSFAVTKTAWDIRNKNVGKLNNDYIGDFMKKPNGQTMAGWDDWKNRISDNFVSKQMDPQCSGKCSVYQRALNPRGNFPGAPHCIPDHMGIDQTAERRTVVIPLFGSNHGSPFGMARTIRRSSLFHCGHSIFHFSIFIWLIYRHSLHRPTREKKSAGTHSGSLPDHFCPVLHVSGLYPGTGT